jgi:DNA helicase-2/ATP-dependent DNA helicase PcrA
VERDRKVHARANRVAALDRGSPYFGHLILEEHGDRSQVLIAKGSAVDRRLPVNIIDWRNAPISRLYYEY